MLPWLRTCSGAWPRTGPTSLLPFAACALLPSGRKVTKVYACSSPSPALMTPGPCNGVGAWVRNPSRKRSASRSCAGPIQHSFPATTWWKRHSRPLSNSRISSPSSNCWTSYHAPTKTGRSWKGTPRRLVPINASLRPSAARKRRDRPGAIARLGIDHRASSSQENKSLTQLPKSMVEDQFLRYEETRAVRLQKTQRAGTTNSHFCFVADTAVLAQLLLLCWNKSIQNGWGHLDASL